MGRFVDLTGQRFGRLTVIERAENYVSPKGRQELRWKCLCECGNIVVVRRGCLTAGETLSCGCLQKERTRQANKKYNTFRISCGKVYVKLSNSEKEMVTDQDIWERCKKYYWSLGSRGYPATNIPKLRKPIVFHIFAFPDCPSGFVRDHINGDKLDNRRENIRFILPGENSMNRGKGKNNTSGHVGVCWNKREEKWVAHIQVDRKVINLGYFTDIQDAIAARKQAEIKYFGEYRRKEQSEPESE